MAGYKKKGEYIKKIILIVTILHIIMSVFINSRERIRFTFINVGQGDSIILEIGSKVILIDGGEGYELDKTIEEVTELYIKGMCQLDIIFLTHPHSDHLEGLNRVLSRCDIGAVMYNDVSGSSQMYKDFLEKIEKNKVINPTMGREINIEDVKLIILWPPDDYPQPENINNISTVILIDIGDIEVLLTGDAEKEVWEKLDYDLLYKFLDPHLEIFKAPHHGAINGLHKESLKRMSPRHCVVSVGVENKFGHPSPEVLEFYEEIGCKTYRTDIHGNVVFTIKRP